MLSQVASVLQIRSCKPEHSKAALNALEVFVANLTPTDLEIPLLPNVNVCLLLALSTACVPGLRMKKPRLPQMLRTRRLQRVLGEVSQVPEPSSQAVHLQSLWHASRACAGGSAVRWFLPQLKDSDQACSFHMLSCMESACRLLCRHTPLPGCLLPPAMLLAGALFGGHGARVEFRLE